MWPTELVAKIRKKTEKQEKKIIPEYISLLAEKKTTLAMACGSYP